METWLTPEFWQDVLADSVRWLIQTSPSILVILILAIIALKSINYAMERLKTLMLRRSREGGAAAMAEVEKRVQTLVGIVRAVAKSIVWAMLVMVLLRKLGIDIAPLIAGAGIAGLAVGFGAQELVRDVISGFFIMLENQVRAGDVAVINGTGGLVESVNMRTITLRDVSGVVHVFQNGKVSTLSNMTKGWSAMVFDMGVAYKEDTDRVSQVMRDVGEELRQDPEFKGKILEPIEILGVDDFADSAVIIKARLKTQPNQQWSVGREYRRRLKKAFDAAAIEIPFPHRSIYWGEASDPVSLLLEKSAGEPSGREGAASA